MGIDEQERLAHRLVLLVLEVNETITACEKAGLRVSVGATNSVDEHGEYPHATITAEVVLVMGWPKAVA